MARPQAGGLGVGPAQNRGGLCPCCWGCTWGPAPQAASPGSVGLGLPGDPSRLCWPRRRGLRDWDRGLGTTAWGPEALPPHPQPPPCFTPSCLCFTHCSEVVRPWLSLEPRPAAQLMDGRRAPRGLSRAGWTSVWAQPPLGSSGLLGRSHHGPWPAAPSRASCDRGHGVPPDPSPQLRACQAHGGCSPSRQKGLGGPGRTGGSSTRWPP